MWLRLGSFPRGRRHVSALVAPTPPPRDVRGVLASCEAGACSFLLSPDFENWFSVLVGDF